jgi:hypothetical protein
MKKYAVTFLVCLIVLNFFGCTSSQNSGKVTETSKKFMTNNTYAEYIKNAPSTRGYKESSADLISYADFNLGLYYKISQGFYGDANSEVLKIAVKNISITQPKIGKIVFEGASLKWPPTDYGYIKPTNDSVIIPREYYKDVAGASFVIDLIFTNNSVGVVTIENWTTIYGTQEEAEGYFNQFVSNNGIKDENLRASVSYRVEIVVLENGKETTLYKDVNLTIFPDDFLSKSYGTQNPYTFENAGTFMQ